VRRPPSVVKPLYPHNYDGCAACIGIYQRERLVVAVERIAAGFEEDDGKLEAAALRVVDAFATFTSFDDRDELAGSRASDALAQAIVGLEEVVAGGEETTS
jgi:hypothetical protein